MLQLRQPRLIPQPRASPGPGRRCAPRRNSDGSKLCNPSRPGGRGVSRLRAAGGRALYDGFEHARLNLDREVDHNRGHVFRIFHFRRRRGNLYDRFNDPRHRRHRTWERGLLSLVFSSCACMCTKAKTCCLEDRARRPGGSSYSSSLFVLPSTSGHVLAMGQVRLSPRRNPRSHRSRRGPLRALQNPSMSVLRHTCMHRAHTWLAPGFPALFSPQSPGRIRVIDSQWICSCRSAGAVHSNPARRAATCPLGPWVRRSRRPSQVRYIPWTWLIRF